MMTRLWPAPGCQEPERDEPGPSHGDSGMPSGIMSKARMARLGAAASSISTAQNRARHAAARLSTGLRQPRLP
jgi:hypothetical protein